MTVPSLTIRWPNGETTAEPGAIVTFGRDQGSTVVLTAPAVSRHHGRLASDGAAWEYTDLGSTQGTFRDGVAVRTLRLDGAVELRLGQGDDAAVVTITPQTAATASDDGDLMTRAAGTSVPPAAAIPPPAPVPPPAPPAPPAGPPLRPGGELVGAGAVTGATEVRTPDDEDTLVVSVGSDRRTVRPGQTLTIGREEGNALVVDEATVSRHHASLAKEGARWVLTDPGSSAGTWLEGTRVTRTELSGRQQFTLGDRATGPTLVTETAVVPGTGAGPSFLPGLRGGRRLVAMLAVVVVVLAAAGFTVYKVTRGVDKNALARATVRLVLPQWRGSGTIIDAHNGLILTNAHVAAPSADGMAVARSRFSDELEANPTKIEVLVTEGRDQSAEPRFYGHVVAVDGYLDVAVVQIDTTLTGAQVSQSELDGLSEVPIGDSDTARSGDAILAIGYPGASESTAPTVTSGIVSGVVDDARLATNRAQINMDATIAPGSSGGLAADSGGRIVGVTTWGLPDSSGQSVLSGIRPINLAKPVIAAAEKGATYVSPWVTPAPASATITDEAYAQPGESGSITGSCTDAAGSGNPLAIGFEYTGFPTGKHTDVMVGLYQLENGSPTKRIAVASSWLGGQFPDALPSSGCFTATLETDDGAAIPAGQYQLEIGVGGDLKSIKTVTFTLH